MTHPFSPIGRLPRLVALLTVVGTIVCMAAGTLAQAPADGPKGRRGSSRSSAARAAPAAETKPAASASAAPAAPAKPPEVKPPEAKPAEAKPAEAKPAEAKPPEAKPAETKPAEAKPAEAKPPEAKPPEVKPPEAKPAEAKPAETKPAEAKPAEAKPPEAKPAGKPAETPAKKPAEPPPEKAPAAAPEKPATAVEPRLRGLKLVDRRGQPISLIMLAHPSMAERLKLTEEQKAKIAALMTEREGALAKVPGPQRSRMIDQYDQKLAAVLSDAQREDLINNPPEPLLRFNYRFQRWIDVLEEVARQAGLSLVLPEAPPPGTLNYSDSKDYTATEAIDLVNGVLSAKGYTLIRREKMLLVVDMSEGLPEGLVPRIPIEELGSRGKFEMVSVLFPLKGRTPATVETEIKPLLGPYGKIVPLPATGQLLITDTAGIMKVISALIESIPVPATPHPPVPATYEPPEPVIYNLKTADPASVMKVVLMLVPNANIVPDAKNRQLTVVAGPTVQGIVKKVIEQVEKTSPPDKQPRLETYPIDESMATQLTTALRQMVPTAIVTVDATNGKLVAWATPEEQTTIKEAAEKLAPLPTGERSRQFEVYRLTRASPSTTLSLLKSLLPNAKMAVDEGSRTLVVIAPATDQKVVKNLLEQLQPEKPGPDTPELRFYALKPHVLANAEKIASAVDHLSPRIQTTPDPTNRRLMVVAPPADQERIKQFLDEYDKKTPEPEKSTLVVYPVTGTQRKRFQSVLTRVQAQLPGMQVLEDTGPGELAIWARPDQQKVVAELLEQLKSEASSAEKHTLVSYPIQAGSTTSVLDMLKKLHPNLQVLPDAEGSRVFVWAHPTDQAAVKASLEQIQAPAPPEKQPRFEAYAIYGAEPKAVVAQLQVLVPNAKLTYDAKTSRLVAFGTAAEHDLLKAAIAKLIRPGGTGIEGSPQLEVYPLTRGDGDALLTTLQNVVPQARLTLDAESKRLIAIAVPEDQKVIKRVLDQIESDKPVPNAPELRFYPLSQAPPATMVTLLQTLAPKAKITLETGGKRLSVVASPADHVTVKAAVEQMDKSLQLEEKSKLVTYPVTPAQRKRFESMVSSLSAELPGIQVLKDTEPSELSIWAKPSQHVAIAEILDQLKRDGAAGEKLQLAVYPIRASDPDSVMTVLKNLFPNAQFTLDKRGRKIMVWTTPSEQEQIKASIETLDAGGAGGAGAVQEKLTVYPVTDADPSTVVSYLEEQVPDAKLTANPKAGTILAWARPADHQTIAKILKDLESGSGQKPQAVVYPVGNGDAKAIWQILHNLVPKATVVVDPKTGSIAATATAREHEMIRSVVEQMSKKEIAESAPRIVTYTIDSGRRGAISSLISILTEQYPAARFVPGLDRGQILAWARPAEQEKIKATISELTKQVPEGAATKLVIYNLESGGAGAVSAAASILRYMFPEAYFAPAGEPGKLIAAASPADHVRIQSVIGEVGKKEPPETAPRIVVYRAKSAAPVPGRRGAYAARAEFGAIPMLRTMFPEAQIAPGAESDQIVVLARPAEHEKIKVAIDQLSTDDPAVARRLAVYALESPGKTGATGIIATLTQMFPEAQFSAGSEPDKVVVWARSDDHKPIETAIQQLSKKEPPEKAPKVVVYQIEAVGPITPTSAISLLTAMYPDAQLSSGQEPGTIVVLARQADHDKIKATIAEMSQKGPADKVRKMVIYTVATGASSASPYYATQALSSVITTLTQMFPNAKFSTGPGSEKVIAWALPEEHKRIVEAIAEITKPEPPERAFKMVVYTVPASTVTSRLSGVAGTTTGSAGVIAALTAMFPSAKFSQGPDPEQIIAWARPDDHKLIAEMVNELVKPEPDEKARMMVVYTVPTTPGVSGRFSPLAAAPGAAGAITALGAMFPHAKFYPGPTSDKVFAWARPDEHKEIAEVVQEMSRPEPAETAHKIAVYVLPATPGDPTGTTGSITLLGSMFPDVKFSAGSEPGRVIAWARPEDHKAIALAIAEMSKKDPADKAFKMVVYTVPASTVTSRLIGVAGTTTGSAGLIAALTAMFPSAKFSQGPDPEQVIAWARPDDHKLIAEMVNELVKPEPEEKARMMVVYTVPTTPDAAARFSPRAWAPGTGGAITALTAMFPHAKFYPGPTSDKVFAWARPDEHKEIAEVVLEMSRPEPAETARKIAVYTVPTTPGDPAGTTGAVALLSAMFPDAKFSAGAEPGTLVAWARPEDHKVIAQAVEEVSKKPPPGKARTMVSYTLESSGRYSDPAGRVALIQSLRQAFSDALFFPGATRGRVVVWARPDDHATIKNAFEEMSKREPLESAPRVESYEVAVLGGTAAMTMLSTAYPEAQFSVGDDANALIVRARPADHELIKATIEQIEATGKAGAKRTLVVYPFKAEDLLTFTDKLDPVLKRRVQLMPDEPRNRLLVWADPKYHQALKLAIDEFTREASKGGDPVSQVYRLDWADPKIVSQVVANVVPNAKVTLDATNRSLVVHAMPEEHARIKATVQQIDNLEGSGMAPSLEIHRMKTGSPDDVLPVLEGLFQMHPSVQLSADRRNESIVAFCTPAQHKTIRTLVEQLEKGMAADSEVRLQTYPLGEMYGYDVVDTLTTLLEKQGITAELSIESRTDSLLVIARPEAHKLILETLEKLKAEERTLQIVQLEVLDPSTAQLAIGRLFGDGLSYRSTNPDVEIDEATEQLFIRATAAQHVKIRELLAKMGETGVAGDADGRTRRSRVIPIRGDVPKTVEQLQKVWPQLRSNPLQVIPAQGQPKRSGASGKSERFGKSGIQKADGPMDVPPERLPKNEVRTAKGQEEAAPDAEGWRPAKSQGEATPADEKPAVEKPAAEKPVVIIPGSRSITVTSDDPEALDQIDKLLRAFSQQRGPIGRNYNVYMLQNANAIGVASILQNFFRSQYGGRFMRANQVTIVPDERLNAIIAYAGRADRTTIENLLDVLDSAEIAQPLAFDRLQFIPVENMPADRMAQVLQELYGTQVGAISVEENTNSLVVMAAPTMVEHIQQVVEKLDEAAGAESDRTVEIISLRNSSSDRVEAALNMLLGPRLQAAARTAPRTPRSATPGAPAVAGAAGQPAGPMTPTSPRARTRRGAGAAGVAGTSPAYRRSAQPTPRPSYRPAMPSGTAPAPMQPTVPRARATPRAGSPATGQGTSPTAPRAAPSTMFRPAQARPTSPTPPRTPAAPRPRGRTAAPTGQPGGGTP